MHQEGRMSSFRKRHVQKPIPGTRTSPQTGQVMTSSGNPSLDVLLGGGLPIGSICLIEEDKHVTHAKVLAKYFLAEGIISNQTVFLGSLDDDPVALLSKLPKPISDGEAENELDEKKVNSINAAEDGGGDKIKNGLRIAWRYNDLPIVNSEPASTKIGHNFNLLEHMDSAMLERADTVTWNGMCGTHNDSSKRISVHEDEETEDEDEIHNLAKRQNMFVQNPIDGPTNNNIDDMVIEQEQDKQQQQPQSVAKEGENEECKEKELALPPPKSEEQLENQQKVEDSEEMDNKTDVNIDELLQETSDKNTTNNLLDETVSSTDVMEVEIHNKSELESTLSCSSAEVAKGEPPKKPGIFENPKYLSLYEQLQPLLRDDKFFHSAMVQKGLCRICITSLGSPIWYREDRFAEDLLKFLTILRACVRSIVSVCFITIPMHLIAKYDETLVAKIRNLVDYSIELESFAGSDRETNPAFEQYNGLLHLRKISAVNALSAHMPETTDLAFKLRRKKFIIEKLHLPPDIQETSTDASTSCSANIGCSSGASSNSTSPAKSVNLASLDF